MGNLTRVEGHPDVMKDVGGSNAVISTDVSAFRTFKNKKMKQKEQEARIQQLESKLANMEVLLEKILEKL